MKKLLTAVLLIVATLHLAVAQNATFSYGCIGVLTSMGPQTPPAGLTAWIDFYDNYIIVRGVEKFTYGGKNRDGSMRFYATKSGVPALNTIGWVISRDFSTAKQVIESSMMGMTMQMEYNFAMMGEGSGPAQMSMGGGSVPYGGGGYYGGSSSGSYSGGSSGSSVYTKCTSCNGTGVCSGCGGKRGSWQDTGYYTGRDVQSWIDCGSCRGSGRCPICYGRGKL